MPPYSKCEEGAEKPSFTKKIFLGDANGTELRVKDWKDWAEGQFGVKTSPTERLPGAPLARSNGATAIYRYVKFTQYRS